MPRQPVYAQVIDDITASIRSGTLRPGDKLPSIADLCVQYRASPQPIRLALRLLDERGWIEVHQGRGSFVAPRQPDA
ncbi:winged helix-turn-helix domain-containing protein [Micromonospora sp. WMMA1363]|uniref:winged helix-turn-helix domain-containing protein n=1 Tax=Micromonospora sp. WMMA1363 TaxID=3053985 RepID=UPI00259CCE04|nr:winged helix-turn-helix domain-containing protein [Micromonospora sp. WMMA1363]MDM4722726.1 winged helix-turn-helix domain-containing protein [Micromonospora sp. WMMA1363]